MADDHVQPNPDPLRPEEVQPQRRPRRPRYDDEDYLDVDVRRRERSPDAVEGLIPYRNPKALIGYYVGVFSLIPCAGLVLGPLALIFGLLGLSYRRAQPTAGGTAHAIVAIVLGAVTTLGNWGFAILGPLALYLEKRGP